MADGKNFIRTKNKKMNKINNRGGGRKKLPPIFLPNKCHVCDKYGKDVALKRCSNCKMIAYCSREHQLEHWKAHKVFCKSVSKAIKLQGPLFPSKLNKSIVDLGILDPDIKLSMEFMKFCLGRELLLEEEQLFMFPRMCCICYSTDHRLLTDCPNCPQTSFCRDHANTDHEQICKVASLCFRAEHSSPNMPIEIPLEYIDTEIPKDMSEIMKHYCMTHDEKKHKMPLDIWTALTSDCLSRPYTFLHAVRKLSSSVFPQKIHLLASYRVDFITVSYWELLFHHEPSLRNLEITLIGPQLDENAIYDMRLCDKCTARGARLKVKCITSYYHEYLVSKYYAKPDFVATFNVGWGLDLLYPSVACSLTIVAIKDQKCPVLFACRTPFNLEDDRKAINGIVKKDVEFVYSGENPYRSLWPWRNPVGPLKFIYPNNYMTVYKKL